MDFFELSYYRFNKQLLMLVGLWPYEASFLQFFIRSTVTYTLYLFACIPQIIAFMEGLYTLDLYPVESIPVSLGIILCTAKAGVLSSYSHKMKILLDHVKYDWKILKTSSEYSIIENYADVGRKYTIIYFTIIGVTVVTILTFTINGPVLDAVRPLNESRARNLIFHGEYFINRKKYFFTILFLQWLCTIVAATVLVATDTLYMVLTQHCCAMFNILSSRIENLMRKSVDSNNIKSPNNIDCASDYNIIHCIQLHSRMINFVKMFESAFAPCFFIDIAFGVFAQSIASFMVILNIREIKNNLSYVCLALGQIVRIFITSYPAQKLIDHSGYVHTATYNSEWYDMPSKYRKMVILLMMRSQVPCKFTIVKLYVMNIENFSMIIRTCLSYCMIMLSLQEA